MDLLHTQQVKFGAVWTFSIHKNFRKANTAPCSSADMASALWRRTHFRQTEFELRRDPSHVISWGSRCKLNAD